ncbi:MAG: pyruvate, phosphate dikinase [Herpetosiphonaceae bacterium]|nr:pyruvate, phosphate dikinase [Herpetosiphonaceae bacterium]
MTIPALQWVYLFRDGDASMKALLGGKGAGVAEMTRAGLPVPPGFTITTEACNAYLANNGTFPAELWQQAQAALADIEQHTGKRFGDPANPLLVSVRSGAALSMPGMMDTVLNLGLNPATRDGMARLTNNPRFAHDAYRRFIQLFGKIVLNVPSDLFEHELNQLKGSGAATRSDADLSAEELAALADRFKAIIQQQVGISFPDDPQEQLRMAIGAVFDSWNGKRAQDYRRVNRISDDLGTAVNVQAMVFGNMGDDSATGVAFTRNPMTGERELFGEYLVNAQGEDVVAGIRTPQPISTMAEQMPTVYEEFRAIAQRLEQHYRDMQDLEFTIERGTLWMLQTRTGKRSASAALKIAIDLIDEGVIDRNTALLRIDPQQLDQLLHPIIDPAAKREHHPVAWGLAASPGAAAGKIVLDPNEAERQVKAGEAVILVRIETAPEDFHGMVVAKAILTARGGRTSHAAVVARGMGKPCVAGCGMLEIDYAAGTVTVNNPVAGSTTLRAGEWISLDGSTGEVFVGQLATVEPEMTEHFATLMGWADEARTVGVRANADTPKDAGVARRFGAEGIGLCRTEHMFFEDDRIDAVREMIVADTTAARRAALAKIEPLQHADFVGIFEAMDGFPVTIRTLDPPLHEFLPHDGAEVRLLARKMQVDPDTLRAKIESLREANPMLGFRGCRLGIIYPEITEMQVRAIIGAAAECQARGIVVKPEIMIPLISGVEELRLQATLVRRIATETLAQHGIAVEYLVGTMIELPRAALTANRVAEEADFFSFGTNDLTQTTLGLSRDDSGRFLPIYVDQLKLIKADPFQTIDIEGVGQLVQMGVERGRSTKPDLKIGVCGEHGGDPESVAFFVSLGLDYVSCSPYRVPIARLAAAQAALGESSRDK